MGIPQTRATWLMALLTRSSIGRDSAHVDETSLLKRYDFQALEITSRYKDAVETSASTALLTRRNEILLQYLSYWVGGSFLLILSLRESAYDE